MFKGVDFWPHDKIFPIMQVRRSFVITSIVVFCMAVALLATRGLNFGIDFKGGSLFEIQSKSGPVDIAELRAKLGGLGLGSMQIQQLDEPTDALIRFEQQKAKEGESSEKAQQNAAAKVQEALGGDIEIRRTEVVGPAVSGELAWAGITRSDIRYLRDPVLHLVSLRVAVCHRRDYRAGSRYHHHSRRFQYFQARFWIERGRGVADACRVFDQ